MIFLGSLDNKTKDILHKKMSTAFHKTMMRGKVTARKMEKVKSK